MFVAKFPGSTYATQAMKAGPRNGRSARSPRRSPESDRSAAASTRASPGRACSVSTYRRRPGCASGLLFDLHATPIPSASSREIACSAFPTRRTIGPPNGSTRRSLTFLPGTSSSSER